ncbi:hypothetical protein PGT21_014172 [Puccinia graminis f. sp. tritici]|uniref:RRM domain-containing protein n=1 Tax=Puccinia graminis f. sp. tritici TaxID=56615 RepID=A0A5B0LUV8_PUCGR|nr:hypothetical protein PGTUg99_036814 [Puccinia graminis f. sp. tritici]KAA1104185.1 hypothetical protein PGT21_014172 [Puccinia graminis f. sp. tritici]
MSRHHPYSGYDESTPAGPAGHRKGGHGSRGHQHQHHSRANNQGGRGAGRGGGGGRRGYGAGNQNADVGYQALHSAAAAHELGFDRLSPPVSAGPPRGPALKNFKHRPIPNKAFNHLNHHHHNFHHHQNHQNYHKLKNFAKADLAGERELSIDERIQRERPCRTLFVRNVKYETDSQEVREKFEEMGEIKIFFDLISTRGMAFITYYDLRAATMAKERLQGTDVSGRPIDVHYSLPKDNELERRCDRDKNQATLFLSITDGHRPINDSELRNKFETYGEIRSIKPFKDSPYQRFVEYWDTRACESAHDSLDGSQYLGGTLELKFSWDTGMVPKGRPDRRAGQDEDRTGFSGPDEGPDYYEHDDRASYEDYARQNGHQNGAGSQDRYSQQSYNSSSTNPGGGAFGKQIDEQRLDQAHKVQELLASLTKAGADGHLNNGNASTPAASVVNNYPSEPSGPKPMSQSGFTMSNPLPSNFVPNYPSYPVGQPTEYHASLAAPTNPGTQNYNQLAQIMGQLSSFSALPLQQPSLSNPTPPPPPPTYPSTINEDPRRLSGSGNPTTPLGLPASVLALLQQNRATAAGGGGATNNSSPIVPTNPAQPPASSYTPSSQPPGPSIPTAPRAMQAAAAIASLSSASSLPLPSSLARTPSLSSAQFFPDPTPPVVANGSSPNPQAAVQQLLALLQQQQQQHQHQHHQQP